MQKAIFLDRDGVLNNAVLINGKPHPPSNLSEVIIPEGVQEALFRLKSMGFLLIGATNQPDVARGVTKQNIVETINEDLTKKLKLDDMRVCYHDDADKCECRKPRPGLILAAAKDYNIDLTKSYMIGDRWKDIEAGKNAGIKTIWLKNNYLEPKPPRSPDLIAASMLDAYEWINRKE